MIPLSNNVLCFPDPPPVWILVMLLVVASSLASFVVLVSAVARGPIAFRDSIISLPITKNINGNGTVDIDRGDQARLMNFASGFDQLSVSTLDAIPNLDIPLSDAGSFYTATVEIGIPPSYCESYLFLPRIVSYKPFLDNVIVDTGSANTRVRANKPYQKTKTSTRTSDILVCIVSRRLLAGLKLKPVNQNATYGTAAVYG
jgi:hypothetical protein